MISAFAPILALKQETQAKKLLYDFCSARQFASKLDIALANHKNSRLLFK